MRRAGLWLAAPALAAALVAGGCASGVQTPIGGYYGAVLAPPVAANTVVGTISGVDTHARVLWVTTTAGQQIPVQYNDQTQVVYQNQVYPLLNLQRGDYVTVQIQGTGAGTYYTPHIQLTQSAAYTGAYQPTGAYQALAGTVSQINYQNGTFVLTQPNGASILVQMPYNPRENEVQMFNSLRNGQYVRLQGLMLGTNRFQISAFM